MKEPLEYVPDIDDDFRNLLVRFNISGCDEKLQKTLAELDVYINADLYTWMLTFLDGEHISAPVTRAFLHTWQNNTHISILALICLLHFLDQETPHLALGLKIGSYMNVKYGGVLGHLCLSSDNLGEVIMRFQRYYQLMFEGFKMRVRVDHTHIFIDWDLIKKINDIFGECRLGAIFVEMCVASLFMTLSSLFNHCHQLYIAVALVGKKPVDVALYQQFFRCPVSFNADCPAVTIPLSVLTLPIDLSNDKLKLLVKMRIQAEMSMHPAFTTDSFLHELQQVLLSSLHDGHTNISYIAEKLVISRANLQRKLSERHLTFSELLDKTRLSLAKMYLEQQHLSMTEIAWLLAFSDQTAFSRSFKRWTGMTPVDFRKLVAKEQNVE
ncbi:MAG: AraC family transcriptional regulator ligand-binding domain-containing protein [Agitococcus sp.]|nr:AraC family transcriptional regulator ligand-binding domain-containing protein [Agitococcus sp.]